MRRHLACLLVTLLAPASALGDGHVYEGESLSNWDGYWANNVQGITLAPGRWYITYDDVRLTAEPDGTVAELPFAIRSPMGNGVGHPLQQHWRSRLTVQMIDSGDAAHVQ